MGVPRVRISYSRGLVLTFIIGHIWPSTIGSVVLNDVYTQKHGRPVIVGPPPATTQAHDEGAQRLQQEVDNSSV